jgi:hypothetical protein
METMIGIIYCSNEWKYRQELTNHTENWIESLESYIFTLSVESTDTKFTVTKMQQQQSYF